MNESVYPAPCVRCNNQGWYENGDGSGRTWIDDCPCTLPGVVVCAACGTPHRAGWACPGCDPPAPSGAFDDTEF